LSSLAFVGAFCRPSPFVKSGFRSSLFQRCGCSTPCVVTLSFHAPNTLALSSYLLRGLIIFSVLFRASPSFHTEATITFLTTRQLCFSSRLVNTFLLNQILLYSLVFVYWPGCSLPRLRWPSDGDLTIFLLLFRQSDAVVQILPSASSARLRPTLRKPRFRHPLWVGSI
jgi:hypothetical protein